MFIVNKINYNSEIYTRDGQIVEQMSVVGKMFKNHLERTEVRDEKTQANYLTMIR